MWLTVSERILVSSLLLRATGDITTVRVIHELQQALSFSEEEHKNLAFVNTELGTHWNAQAGDLMKDVPIGEKARDVVVNMLKDLDNRHQLTADHIGAYERFVEGKEAEA